jgi:hypothetical protein
MLADGLALYRVDGALGALRLGLIGSRRSYAVPCVGRGSVPPRFGQNDIALSA